MIISGTILSICTTTVNEATITSTTSSVSTVVQLGGCEVEEGEGHTVAGGCVTLRFDAPPTDNNGEPKGVQDMLRCAVAYDGIARTYSRAPWPR